MRVPNATVNARTSRHLGRSPFRSPARAQRGVPIGTLGSHAKPVRCLEFSPSTGLLYSGGWDGQISAWDPRAKEGHVATVPMPAKV